MDGVDMRYLVYFAIVRLAGVFLIMGQSSSQRLEEYFKSCKIHRPNFDVCIKIALNRVKPFFRTGVPEYGVPPFEPVLVDSMNATLGDSEFNMTYKLSGVVERDWTKALFIHFKSDLKNNRIQFTMLFPDKRVNGDYDFQVSVPGTTFRRAGGFYFRFFDYVKTTTITWPTVTPAREPFVVQVTTRNVKDVVLEYTNLQRGNFVIENQLNNFINANAQKVFGLQRPVLDKMESRAFTQTYNRAFENFPFQAFFS